jgi:hypothetical protein
MDQDRRGGLGIADQSRLHRLRKLPQWALPGWGHLLPREILYDQPVREMDYHDKRPR